MKSQQHRPGKGLLQLYANVLAVVAVVAYLRVANQALEIQSIAWIKAPKLSSGILKKGQQTNSAPGKRLSKQLSLEVASKYL